MAQLMGRITVAFKDARKGRGLYLADVVRTERISPHFIRVTVKSEALSRLPHRGFDHWFRLFLPKPDQRVDYSRVPESFGMTDYFRYLAAPAETRPVFRSYTVREHRPEAGEIDIDFVAHGDQGVAGPWAQAAQPGHQVAILDQGCGFDPIDDADFYLLAGDESALPAIMGILRDLPRHSRGLAIIEIPHIDDQQQVEAPEGFEIRWIARDEAHGLPGAAALEAVQSFTPENPETLAAYVVGERMLATEGRRALVRAGVPKNRISFVGYWRQGKAQA